MPWIRFAVSAAILVYASMQLAKHGDVIAIRTGLGGLFMGTLLIAMATTLPEMLVLINAVSEGMPDLAVGGLLGSNMLNILILAILDLVHQRRRILRRAAMRHALTGSLAVLMTALVVFFIFADLPFHRALGSVAVGIDSVILIATYVLGMMLVESQSRTLEIVRRDEPIADDLPALWPSLGMFGLSAGVLVLVTPWLVESSGEIAVITGLGQTFIGATLLAIATSVPELVTTISAARIGADDMAIGNLFGSNMFNMALFGFADLFLLGRFMFPMIDDSFMTVGMLALIMGILGLLTNVARLEKRFFFIEIDALVLIVVYLASMALLFSQGLTP